jgi:hypothetical protein
MARHYRKVGAKQLQILKRLQQGPATANELTDIVWPGRRTNWTKGYNVNTPLFSFMTHLVRRGWISRQLAADGSKQTVFTLSAKGAKVAERGRYLGMAPAGGPRRERVRVPAVAAKMAASGSNGRSTVMGREPIVVSVGSKSWHFDWALKPREKDVPELVQALAERSAQG